MKITITIPDGVWVKLESDRGLVPRSTWIQELIISSGKKKPYVVTEDEPKPWGGSMFKDEGLNSLVKSGKLRKGIKN